MTLTTLATVLILYILLDALATGYLINKTVALKPAWRLHDVFICTFIVGYVALLVILLRSLI